MYPLLVFCALPSEALFCAACLIVHDGHAELRGRASVLHLGHDPIVGTPSNLKGSRAVELISAEELRHLLYQSDDIILIDLRSNWERKSLASPAANTLSVAPSQLRDLLFWLPPASSVVLYGSSDLCVSVTRVVRHLPGVAPIYVLRESDKLIDFDHGELRKSFE
jgi:hypothetical protein